MRHERALRHLSEYIDGTLRGESARRVEAHLSECNACQAELAALRRTTELLRGLRGTEDAPDLAPAVIARIRAGEADPSALARLRAAAGRIISGTWVAPLATAAVALAVLAVVPRVEIEVSIPGLSPAQPGAQVARAPTPPRQPAPALATRRVNEPRLPSASLPVPAPALSVDCWEQPSFDACQEQRRLIMELALRDTPAFLEQVEAVPSPQRERWIGEMSRFAAEDGSASTVAQQLRASDDPRAWQMAPRFEEATFDRR